MEKNKYKFFTDQKIYIPEFKDLKEIYRSNISEVQLQVKCVVPFNKNVENINTKLFMKIDTVEVMVYGYGKNQKIDQTELLDSQSYVIDSIRNVEFNAFDNRLNPFDFLLTQIRPFINNVSNTKLMLIPYGTEAKMGANDGTCIFTFVISDRSLIDHVAAIGAIGEVDKFEDNAEYFILSQKYALNSIHSILLTNNDTMTQRFIENDTYNYTSAISFCFLENTDVYNDLKNKYPLPLYKVVDNITKNKTAYCFKLKPKILQKMASNPSITAFNDVIIKRMYDYKLFDLINNGIELEKNAAFIPTEN